MLFISSRPQCVKVFIHTRISVTHFQTPVIEMPTLYWHTNLHTLSIHVNTLRPRQHGRHFADDTFKRIFLNENIWISIKISLKFVPKSPIDNIPAFVQIMAWHRPGDKPLSEAMMVSLLTHICVARPQWVKSQCYITIGVHCMLVLL